MLVNGHYVTYVCMLGVGQKETGEKCRTWGRRGMMLRKIEGCL